MSRRPSPIYRPLPVGPLEAALRRGDICLDSLPGADQAAIFRARRQGWVTLATGDAIACRVLREHPSLIWGEAWWEPSPATN